MEKDLKASKSSRSPATTDDVAKSTAENQAQGKTASKNDLGQGTDRPGFDQGGSAGDTHTSTGVGLGEDAFDTPGDRRLPGRQLVNKLTIPRWGGPEPQDTIASDKATKSTEAPPAPQKSKAR